jgi:GLPGLI family protein
MKITLSIFILLFSLNAHSLYLLPKSETTISIAKKTDSCIFRNDPFTIVYDIQVKVNKKKTGIEETYNGGIKTIFIHNNMARVRMVSLMRIESLYFSSPINSTHPVSIVKESGKNKYRYNLTNEEWNLLNTKYDKDSCVFLNDSTVILNYLCRKAVIMLKDGRTLSIYYTPLLKPIDSKVEPAFNGIPGLVLQYEYDYKKGSVTYTASKISEAPIASNIFKLPTKGYKLKKYCTKCSTTEAVTSHTLGID